MKYNSTIRVVSDGSLTAVALTFDVREQDEVHVYFNDDQIETGFTVDRQSTPQRVLFDPPVPDGVTVTIRRYSDMRAIPHVFHLKGGVLGGAEFNSLNIDENFDHILRASQDAMDSFEIVGINIQAAYDAKSYAAEAKTYKDAAESAKNRAVSAEVASGNSADAAAASASNALDSEIAARSSEIAAAGSAGEAEASADQAAASAADAANSAGEATASAASALASKEAAELSASVAKDAEDAAVAASSTAQAASANAEVSAGEAAASATEAASSEELAKRWATNPEDEVVEDGLFSAKHWALKASQIVGNANDVITSDTPEIQFSGTGRPLSPLKATIGSVDVSKVEGLGSAATRDVGTTGGTVAAGDDLRITGALQKYDNLADLIDADAARGNLGLGSAAIANVVHGTGNSTTDVMNQKTVTDALNTKADATTQVIAGTGLTGGGNLSTNRTLSVKYGTSAGTAAQGNDSRIVNALQRDNNLSDVANPATARDNLGLGSAAIADVVGTMDNGAIIERGSNSNGEYVKFADGTQICKVYFTPIDVAGNNWRVHTWEYPAEFVGSPVLSVTSVEPYSAYVGSGIAGRDSGYVSGISVRVSVANITSATRMLGIDIVAIGRWY